MHERGKQHEDDGEGGEHAEVIALSRSRRVGKGAQRRAHHSDVATCSASYGGHGAKTRPCPPYATLPAKEGGEVRSLPLERGLQTVELRHQRIADGGALGRRCMNGGV